MQALIILTNVNYKCLCNIKMLLKSLDKNFFLNFSNYYDFNPMLNINISLSKNNISIVYQDIKI